MLLTIDPRTQISSSRQKAEGKQRDRPVLSESREGRGGEKANKGRLVLIWGQQGCMWSDKSGRFEGALGSSGEDRGRPPLPDFFYV